MIPLVFRTFSLRFSVFILFSDPPSPLFVMFMGSHVRLRPSFRLRALDLARLPQRNPHAYSVMLLQNITNPSRPHLTTGKKHYLLLDETHCFWAKRFGLVILEAMVNISLRFQILNVWLFGGKKKTRRAAESKPEAMQSSSFTEITPYSLLRLKYGKYTYWIY